MISRFSKISKINTPLLIIAIVSIFAFATTKAFFTTSEQSDDHVFVSGTLDISLTQDNILNITDWRPGEIRVLEFDVNNTGSLPVLVKGYLDGNWSEPGLDPNLFNITSIDILVNGVWEQISQGEILVGDEFHLSSDGTDNQLYALIPGEQATVRISTKLSEATPDEYQNQSFTASLHMAGKQSADGSDWPTTY